jgi:hypothetical protein
MLFEPGDPTIQQGHSPPWLQFQSSGEIGLCFAKAALFQTRNPTIRNSSGEIGHEGDADPKGGRGIRWLAERIVANSTSEPGPKVPGVTIAVKRQSRKSLAIAACRSEVESIEIQIGIPLWEITIPGTHFVNQYLQWGNRFPIQ